MLRAMAVVVLEVIALVFQGMEGLIVDLPPGATAPHEVKDIPCVHSQVCAPAAVLDLVLAHLPVLDHMDPSVWVGGIERDIIDKAKSMHKPRRAVVPLIR